MRRAYERGTKARLNFFGGPHAPVNMADSVEELNEVGEKCRKWHSRNFCSAALRYISYATLSQIPEVLRDLCLFGSRNSRTTGILHTVRHVYRRVWPTREAKPRFGTALERSAHDRETRLLFIYRQDFEACTQALQDMGYSTPALTAARGVSAGGLVLGAVCNRSPDLFRAAVLKVCERNSCTPDDNSGFLSIGR